MPNQTTTQFKMYEMIYQGGAVQADTIFVPYEEIYYERYKELINSCYFPMRKALNIRPYDRYCDTAEELAAQKENVFLLFDDEEIVATVTCLGSYIENVAVNPKYQGKGYGRQAVVFALGLMQERGVFPIKLTVTEWNARAISLYRSLGFVVASEAMCTGVSTLGAGGQWSFSFTDTGGLDVR